MGPLCVRCGETGHIAKECTGRVLPVWEQSYLKSIVFGDNPQSNFCVAGFGSFDGNVSPYSVDFSSSSGYRPKPSASMTGSSISILTPIPISTPTSGSTQNTNVQSSSVTYGMLENITTPVICSSNIPKIHTVEASHISALHEEESGPNKRIHYDATISPSQVPQLDQSGKPKKRAQKKVGQKVKPQPLIGMFDDVKGAYDKPISVRQALRANKVDMTWMDFIAWSPEACKELKRLCTRVAKKKTPKVNLKIAPNLVVNPFLPTMPFNPTIPVGPIFPPVNSMFPEGIPRVSSNGPFATQPTQYQPSTSTPQIQYPGTTHQNVYLPPQNFQPLQNNPSQLFQNNPPHAPQPVIQPMIHTQTQQPNQTGEVSNATLGIHTQFFQTLKGTDKAFRIECSVLSGSGISVILGKAVIQADQGSDMNIISEQLLRQLELPLNSLENINFGGLTMRTADHRDTPLKYWTEFNVTVSGLSRQVRSFVSPRVSIAGSSTSGHYSLLLGLPWLFSVNAFISIRHSKITIGDSSIGETIRDIVGPEMVFCAEHTLLMYPRKALIQELDPKKNNQKGDTDESGSSDDESSEDDLSDIEDETLF